MNSILKDFFSNNLITFNNLKVHEFKYNFLIIFFCSTSYASFVASLWVTL